MFKQMIIRFIVFYQFCMLNLLASHYDYPSMSGTKQECVLNSTKLSIYYIHQTFKV